MLTNDTDADAGTTLTATLVANASNGTATLAPAGGFTYTPNANFSGTDSFTYTASDGTAVSNVATVTITVTAVNDAPIAVNDAAATTEDAAVSGNVLTNDTDADAGTTLTATLVANPANGSVTLASNGAFTFTPNANFNGTTSFTYTASDGTATSNVATVTITIGAVNDAPVAAGDSYATAEDTLLTIAAPGVVGNDTDVDSASLTAVLVSGPANGTLTLNANGSFSYTPNANFNGSDSFTYRASDGTLTSAAAVVSITVNAVNDPPVVSAGPDRNVVFPAAASLAGTAVDIDGPALVRVWSQVSGPGTAMFADPNAAATTATFYGRPAPTCCGSRPTTASSTSATTCRLWRRAGRTTACASTASASA